MITVTGATGNVGRPLVEALTAAGERVNTVTRGAAATGQYVTHYRADLSEPESLKPALEGAEALFVVTAADFIVHGDMSAVMATAKASGVRRVVLLSSQGVATGRHLADFEEAVMQSGLEWTMLRPGNFDSNAFGWAESVRTRRTVEAPFGDIALPAIDPADIAAVAAAALLEPGHAGRAYTLTGPAAISPREQAAAIGEAVGEPVAFAELTRDEARARMLGFMPERVVEATLGVLGTPSPAEQAVSPDVERVLGRPATPFAEWAKRNAAAFR
ncbi:NAD(P)H-binding protein [Glycomyces terrestris]|uniref:NAD-dependent epimerase/dehydratase family protein n=1 Tax=Glycomyces terrestris TaxID=2493553 RepID=A0A426V0X9_9ACTN|nr:NAD(P)H-binding protein [Glycomyces terrestris]RRS00493.1 NAD-dependent epimerase/dehydratase family protein [Glycomyces terrestris]